MRSKLRNFLWIFSPVLLVSGLDLFLKKILIESSLHSPFSFLEIMVTANKGIIGGYLSEQAKPIFQIPMITVGFFLLVCLYFIQLFAPIKSKWMRLAISVYFGGVFANVIDRLIRGYVVDYLVFHFGSITTPAFNLADIFQYVGILMMFILQFKPSTFDDTYSEKLWISKEFQKRYSLQLVKLGFFLILVFGVLSYTFVNVALKEVSIVGQAQEKLMHDYLIFFLSTSVTFLIFLYLIGKSLSAYVAKPIVNFEHYLRALAKGNYTIFEVDEPEFNYLERLSDDVRDHMMDMTRKIQRLEARGKKE